MQFQNANPCATVHELIILVRPLAGAIFTERQQERVWFPGEKVKEVITVVRVYCPGLRDFQEFSV